MKKEVAFAVILGLVVGLIITGGMLRARRAVEDTFPTSSQVPSRAATPIPTSGATTTQSSDITITSPLNESVSKEAAIQVSGKTVPNSMIIVLQADSEVPAKVDEQGNFSVPVTLSAGGNILTIRVLKTDGSTSSVTRSVILSSADLTSGNTAASPEPTASTSAKKKATPVPSPGI